MATKKSMWVFIGILVISAWVLGSTTPALSESIKCKREADPGKREQHPVLPGQYYVGSSTQEAVATCDNGETPTVKNYSVWAATIGKENLIQGYIVFIFKDNSKIVMKFNSRSIPDPEGKAEWISDTGTVEIIKGTLRFNGISGKVSFKGKTFDDHRTANEWTIDYTLPSK